MSVQQTETPRPHVPTPSPTPVSPRRRGWRRRLMVAGICLLALLAVPVIGYFVLSWHGERSMQAVIEETDRLDPRWRINDVLADRAAIPDDENSALVALKVDKLLRSEGGFSLGIKYDHAFDDIVPQRRLNGVQIEALRQALDKHEKALPLARSLKDFSGEGRYPIKYTADMISTSLDVLAQSRGVAHLLQNDAWRRAEEGDIAGAMQSCRAILALARSVGDEPVILAALVRIAEAHIAVGALERTLAQGRAPEEELKAMQELIRREMAAPFLVTAMRGERASFDVIAAELQHGKVKVSGLVGRRAPTWEDWLLDHFPVVALQGRPECLRLLNKAVEASKLPPEKQAAEMDTIEKEIRGNSNLLARTLLPAVTKVSHAHCRNQANLSCALCAVAAERYRLHHGAWPVALQDLVDGGWIEAVPIDPFDGQPLRYKRVPGEGVVIYSVGLDGVDNGGVLDRERMLQPGTDLGFLLFDEARRRQAPLPPKLIED